MGLTCIEKYFVYTEKYSWDVDQSVPATKDYIAVESPTFLISNLLFYIIIVGFGRARIRRTQRKQDLQNGSPGLGALLRNYSQYFPDFIESIHVLWMYLRGQEK